jgi:hypothetical protein
MSDLPIIPFGKLRQIRAAVTAGADDKRAANAQRFLTGGVAKTKRPGSYPGPSFSPAQLRALK